MVKKRESKVGYLTRTQAVRYLQVSLADFRRLCILKGIYPRDLTGRAKRRIQKGSTKPLTAYYRKDIQYLAHEPILDKFRAHKAFAKKLTRAIGRGDYTDAVRIDRNRPRYTLDHIIKERYPTFVDAVNDLDDALSTLFLFAQMPATDKVSHRITADAERLSTEWMAYVAREHLLQKVFVSIKGVYYQARVHGVDVRWVVPHKFPQNVPSDIDFRIMLTFLEFYTTLVHFVLFKLYTEAGLVYPPQINAKREHGVGGIGTYILQSRQPTGLLAPTPAAGSAEKESRAKIEIEKALAADQRESGPADAAQADEDADADDADAEEGADKALDEFSAAADGGDVLLQPAQRAADLLFSKLTFYVGREVPLDLVEFVVLAHGGAIISEAALDEQIDNEDESADNHAAPVVDLTRVTHQISDRPALRDPVVGRVYVQPQWLLDSVNGGKLLEHAAYAPGQALPPHLSPWGDRGEYDPEESDDEAVEEVAAAAAREADAEAGVDAAAEAAGEADDAEDDDEADEPEPEEPRAGASKPARKLSEKRKRKVDEEKELRKSMMSKKQRVLYDKLQGSIDKEEARKHTLREKRRQLRG